MKSNCIREFKAFAHQMASLSCPKSQPKQGYLQLDKVKFTVKDLPVGLIHRLILVWAQQGRRAAHLPANEIINDTALCYLCSMRVPVCEMVNSGMEANNCFQPILMQTLG